MWPPDHQSTINKVAGSMSGSGALSLDYFLYNVIFT